MVKVRYERGVELPDHGLWLDPRDAKPFAFVSHAHSDHIGRHAGILTSEATARLMRARLSGQRTEQILEFGQPARVREMTVTLLPAGHILGSAQFHMESAEGSLLYTGDFKLRHGLSAEPAELRHAETLVMETTFGLPKYRFPPTDEVIAAMVAFCREALEDGAVPVLFGYSLGKAQEILCALTRAGLEPMLHGAVHTMTRLYRELRPDFPPFHKFDPAQLPGKVLICPPSASRSRMILEIPNRRTAILTGWAMDPNARFRYQCDAAFPLSDHADYPDLLETVRQVCPSRVLTLHGFAAPLARDLRAMGIEAWALTGDNQLELSLQSAHPARTASPSAPPDSNEDGSLAQFAALTARIAATPAKLSKARLLSDYLRSLDEVALPIAATYLTGRPFPQNDDRVLHAGWAVIQRALRKSSGLGEAELREIAHRHADAGRTAAEALQGRTRPEPLDLPGSLAFFNALAAARGPIAKTEKLSALLSGLSAQSGSALIRILTGDLRIGLKEGLLEEALAVAFDVPVVAVKEAHMLLGDIGATATLARAHRLHEASMKLFQPVKSMLASPEPDADAIWRRLEQEPGAASHWWAEDKLDGIRAQLHRSADRVELYSRDLRNLTAEFTDLATHAADLESEVILDGEIIAFSGDRKLTFFDLQKRLGRKNRDLFLPSDIPVVFAAFDLLFLDGHSLTREPLEQRRAALERLVLPPQLHRVEIRRVSSSAGIEAAFDAARARRNEGLILKDGRSAYTPGRRGLSWLKLKKELATLDVVVVGVEAGHGKRSHVLSDYTFAVRDDTTGRLATIGKAYTGLTDAEIADLTRHFAASTIAQHGRYREVVPDVVLEIAFDSIQPSRRHASGLALRFPRIKAIRRDKAPESIDTLDYARSLLPALPGRG